MPSDKDERQYNNDDILYDYMATFGNLVDMSEMGVDGPPDVGGAAFGGALSGAGAGAALGPAGAVGGALIGGVTSAIRAGRDKQRYEDMKETANKNRIANKRVDPFFGYMEEGGIVVRPRRKKVVKMYEQGGEINVTPVQTEEGELVLLPTGDIVDSKAAVSHERMEKDKITDILPVGSYVFSADESMVIDPDNLTDEEDIIGLGDTSYEEGEKPKEIKEVRLSDIMNGDKMTPAELADKIRKKFKVVVDENDAFLDQTNEENKMTRLAYLKKVIELSEAKNPTIEPEEEGEEVEQFNTGGYTDGLKRLVRRVKDRSQPNPYNLINTVKDFVSPEQEVLSVQGANIIGNPNRPSLDTLIQPLQTGEGVGFNHIEPVGEPGISDRFANNVQQLREKNRLQFDDDMNASDRLFRRARTRAGLSLGAGAIAAGFQDPTVDPVLETIQGADQMFQKTSESAIAPVSNRLRRGLRTQARGLVEAGARPGDLASYTAGTVDAIVQGENDLRRDFIMQNDNLDRQKAQFINNIVNKNQASITNASNQTRTGANKRISVMGSNVQNFLGNQTHTDQLQMRHENDVRRQYNTNDINLLQTDIGIYGQQQANDILGSYYDSLIGQKENAFRSDIPIEEEDPIIPAKSRTRTIETHRKLGGLIGARQVLARRRIKEFK